MIQLIVCFPMHSGTEKDLSEAQKYLNAINIAQRQLEETTKSKVYADLEKVYPKDVKVWINFLLILLFILIIYLLSCHTFTPIEKHAIFPKLHAFCSLRDVRNCTLSK